MNTTNASHRGNQDLHTEMVKRVSSRVDSWIRCGSTAQDAIRRTLAGSAAGPAVVATVRAMYGVAE
jgi:hypothetical protein